MQAVILAGGLGGGLRALTESLPKPMVDVHGKPFLEYELALLRERGVTDVVLCLGHLAEGIMGHFGDGSRFGLRIAYSVEIGCLLGTAGAVKQAEPLLDGVFFLTYADSYLRVDYGAVLSALRRCGGLGLMVVLHVDARYDLLFVPAHHGRALASHKERAATGMD